MHVLVLSGIILLSISGLVNAYFWYRLLTIGQLQVNVPFLLSCIVLLYIGVSIGFRASANQKNIHFFIGTTGILLACFTIAWTFDLLQNYKITLSYSIVIILLVSLMVSILTILFLKSEIATDLLTLPTGLMRYKLTEAGRLLFSICFLFLFATSTIGIANFKNLTRLGFLSHIAIFLSLAAVIFPWKEIGLNVILIAAATTLRVADQIRENIAS